MPHSIQPTYRPSLIPCPVTELPFVAESRCELHYWSVAPTTDYGQAWRDGCRYAAEFVEWLQNSGDTAQHLPRIVAHAPVQSPKRIRAGDRTHGYQIGFLSVIEEILREAVIRNPRAVAEAMARIYPETQELSSTEAA